MKNEHEIQVLKSNPYGQFDNIRYGKQTTIEILTDRLVKAEHHLQSIPPTMKPKRETVQHIIYWYKHLIESVKNNTLVIIW